MHTQSARFALVIGAAFGAQLSMLPNSAAAQTCGVPGTGTGQPNFGEAMCGITATAKTQFTAGKTAFSTVETAAEGLGPVFNGNSCVSCHSQGGTGGGSTLVETRFGRVVNGVFDPMASIGGSLIQTTGIGPTGSCNYVGEVVPSGATVRAGRLTTPLFGLGLIDNIATSTLENLAANQPASQRGHTAKITDPAGHAAIGKFGWKAQVATVFDFSGDAYLNEMGITSPAFPAENCPQGNCALLSCDPIPEATHGPEDAGDDVQAFADFMSNLAPPPQKLPLSVDATAGAALFGTLGCATCHTASITTAATGPVGLRNRVIFPYSDFLLHDMGSLGDGIAQGGAKGTEMRTAPLWGARVRTRFLHDGRAVSVSDAILAHAGQGQAARNLYNLLPAAQKNQVVAFINTL
jgi:CxxC motif-containing protein (DUF1111 family)